MGLYLCVFDNEEEIDGVEVGLYSEYNSLRDYITREIESGVAGSRFPTFILHSDCDGEWSFNDCELLKSEIAEIILVLKTHPANKLFSDRQNDIMKSTGLVPTNAFECFIDVDGEFLLERLQNLVKVALEKKLPILFQ